MSTQCNFRTKSYAIRSMRCRTCNFLQLFMRFCGLDWCSSFISGYLAFLLRDPWFFSVYKFTILREKNKQYLNIDMANGFSRSFGGFKIRVLIYYFTIILILSEHNSIFNNSSCSTVHRHCWYHQRMTHDSMRCMISLTGSLFKLIIFWHREY